MLSLVRQVFQGYLCYDGFMIVLIFSEPCILYLYCTCTTGSTMYHLILYSVNRVEALSGKPKPILSSQRGEIPQGHVGNFFKKPKNENFCKGFCFLPFDRISLLLLNSLTHGHNVQHHLHTVFGKWWRQQYDDASHCHVIIVMLWCLTFHHHASKGPFNELSSLFHSNHCVNYLLVMTHDSLSKES